MQRDPYASGRNSWVCRLCRYIGKNSNVRRHIILKHTIDEELPCPICRKIIRNKQAFNTHLKANHPEMFEVYKFSLTNSRHHFTYNWIDSLLKTSETWPREAWCSQLFDYSKSLTDVCLFFPGVSELMLKDPFASGKNSWVCRVCGYHGKNSNVKRHIILKHAQHEHLPCPGCNQVLRNKEYFNVHVSTNHPELYESHKYSIANSKFYFWSLNVTKQNFGS